MATPASARLDAWIDFNINGVFDPAEQIFSSATILAGTNTLTFAVPVTAVAGGSYARFRVSTTRRVGTDRVWPARAKSKTIGVNIEPPRFDFGDAANSYVTLLLSNGARHLPGGPRLGNLLDTEANGVPTAAATGDDAAVPTTRTACLWRACLSAAWASPPSR